VLERREPDAETTEMFRRIHANRHLFSVDKVLAALQEAKERSYMAKMEMTIDDLSKQFRDQMEAYFTVKALEAVSEWLETHVITTLSDGTAEARLKHLTYGRHDGMVYAAEVRKKIEEIKKSESAKTSFATTYPTHKVVDGQYVKV
jgi:hypothetical protein